VLSTDIKSGDHESLNNHERCNGRYSALLYWRR